MNFLDRQINDAKNNYNFFFMKLIFSIFKIIFKLTVALLISSIFNYVIINIIVLLFTIYSIMDIIYTYKYYLRIINDIRNTINCDLIFEIDFKMVNFDMLRGVVKYGK